MSQNNEIHIVFDLDITINLNIICVFLDLKSTNKFDIVKEYLTFKFFVQC